MNRTQLQSLAKERVKDAKALLGRKRWAAAYYLAGYAVECGLKACVLRHIDLTGAIFEDAKYLKDLAGCWTHDLTRLVALADLNEALGLARQQDQQFDAYWSVGLRWNEVSRYKETTESKARELFKAITDPDHGVLQWVRTRW